MTFWQRVEKALKDNNITEAELSRRIGFTQAGINGWKVKGALPRADIAIKTASVLNTTVEYLINGSPNFSENKSTNSFLIPVLNQELSAGHGDILPEQDIIQGLISVPNWLRKAYGQNLASLHVHGDSMQPTLNDGDMIVCDSLGWDNSDGLYAIRMNGNGYVKRIQVANDKIFIISDNPVYKTIEEPLSSEAVNIIGKVRLVIYAI